ncbi:hypothetical protein SAMN05421734_102210 [Pelagirhabdus alkalitolerans]|uniref:YlxP-like protein n=1 Tax=Pelagirhabdus alkalitolerans TaxID=1612202 RepID=A0A1G6H4P1_9BACI|nr:DUF503 family protein [Pelagirhabdus alkalitolerans]SDB89058.1 hypothetical protein SAMN05421734_102210 [Pelagirhabdus alkalitolerans]
MLLYVEVDGFIYESHSLKQKRSVLKRLMLRLQNNYNITISELDHHDLWQRTLIGMAVISNDRVQCEKVIDRCLELMDTFGEIEITHIERHWLD